MVAYLRSVTIDPDIAGVLRAWDAAMEMRGLASTTRATYRYELLRFYVDFAALASHALSTMTADDLASYILGLPVNGSKRGDAIRALKAFFSWAAMNIREDDPAGAFKVRRVHPPRAPDLTDEEVHRLVRAAFHRSPRRGWAIVLCLATGARIGSLVAAKAEDVHDGYIWFRQAKGDRPYEVPLTREGQIACAQLAALGGSTLLGVSAQSFRTWVHQAGTDAGIPQRVWPHLLRHVTLTRVARVTDPATVARIANWADLSQFTRYIAVDEEAKRASLTAVFHRRG